MTNRKIFLTTLLLGAAHVAPAATLSLEVGNGIRAGEPVLVAVYDSEANWNDRLRARIACGCDRHPGRLVLL